MKRTRQEKILELISERAIETQTDLTNALRAAGIRTTQASVSRDIRELGLTKMLGANGISRYVLPRHDLISGHTERLRTIFKECVISVACAQNLVILKTLPGLASAACSAIDTMDYPGLVGTLAGDDTAFLAMENDEAAERFRLEIAGML